MLCNLDTGFMPRPLKNIKKYKNQKPKTRKLVWLLPISHLTMGKKWHMRHYEAAQGEAL